MVSFNCGSLWTIWSVRLFGTGAGPDPNSLFAGSIFQVPLRSDLAKPCTTPPSIIKTASADNLNIRLLLLFEQNLLIRLTHGARNVTVDGQSLAVGGEFPAILGREIGSVETAFAVHDQVVAVPIHHALHLVAGKIVGAFLAVGGVSKVEIEVAHLAGLGEVDLQAG